MIELKNITYKYKEDGETVLDHISMTITNGEWLSIIGHNGSGKSTLVKIIMGIISDYNGSIVVNNTEINTENSYELRKKFSIVFQNPDNQFVGATVEDDVVFGLENHGVPREEMIRRTEKALKAVKMSEYRSHAPARLSGGQKQRVAIAGALVMQPDVLILDEATSMLDPEGRSEVLEILREIHKEGKTTIIYITHDLTEIEDSDHAVILKAGKVISTGTVEDIYKDTKSLVESNLVLPFQMKISEALLNGEYVTYDELVNRL